MQNLISLIITFYIISCAGPTNPFGGEIFITQNVELDDSFEYEIIKMSDIEFDSYPKKQYYNSPFNLTLRINDPNFDKKNFKYRISYNNQILNRWYKSETIEFPNKRYDDIKIIFKNLSILPGNINKIKFFYYPNKTKEVIVYQLEVPDCYKEFKNQKIQISPFKIKNTLKENLIFLSKKYRVNPSLMAALIAQESSFDPNALSFAYALGLTQVTPIAAKEVSKYKDDWEIYPDFTAMSLAEIKSYIGHYKINPLNDWRLDPKKSIEGGILYLKHLQKYWGQPSKQKLLNKTFKNEIPLTDILLASYNSGAYRVKNSIKRHNQNWLFDENLSEARKYVMNIKSYCYAFNQGTSHEK